MAYQVGHFEDSVLSLLRAAVTCIALLHVLMTANEQESSQVGSLALQSRNPDVFKG
jgi:hypothetical protein